MKDYEFYGIRVDYEHYYKVGDIHVPSHQWWQDDPEDGSPYDENEGNWDGGELPGTCALECTLDNMDEVIAEAKDSYFGEAIYLIGGNVAEGGNDIGEIIIEDAEILQVIE